MSDYLEQIAAAKADVARLKGEKEAFEQSNEPATILRPRPDEPFMRPSRACAIRGWT